MKDDKCIARRGAPGARDLTLSERVSFEKRNKPTKRQLEAAAKDERCNGRDYSKGKK